MLRRLNAVAFRSAPLKTCPELYPAGERLGGEVGRRRMMMAAKPGKIKKGRSGKALDRKTVSLLELLDARPEPM